MLKKVILSISILLLMVSCMFATDFNELQGDLAVAINTNDFAKADKLIAQGADLNKKWYGDYIIVKYPSSYEGLKYCISKGANVNVVNQDGRTAFGSWLAWYDPNRLRDIKVKQEREKCLRLIVSSGLNKDVLNGLLIPLCYHKDEDANYQFMIEEIDLRLSLGTNINDIDTLMIPENLTYGLTAISATVMGESKYKVALIKYLVSKGADVNLKLKPGYDALSLAIRQDALDYDVINTLVNYGANVNVKDENGDTPLSILVQKKQTPTSLKVLKLLLSKGADVNTKDTVGNTPLISSGLNVEYIKLLISKGANINVVNRHGASVLSSAVGSNDIKFVKYLLQHGANPNLRQNPKDVPSGQTGYLGSQSVLMGAVGGGDGDRSYFYVNNIDNLEMIKLLIANKADLNIRDTDGRTALSYVKKQIDTANEILANGKRIGPNIEYSKYGIWDYAPVNIAQVEKRLKILIETEKLLISKGAIE